RPALGDLSLPRLPPQGRPARLLGADHLRLRQPRHLRRGADPGRSARALLAVRAMTGAVAPRPAATVVLVRAGGDGAGPELLMVQRARGASFMADAFVFPG